MTMDRRDFLKRMGAAAIAIGIAPSIIENYAGAEEKQEFKLFNRTGFIETVRAMNVTDTPQQIDLFDGEKRIYSAFVMPDTKLYQQFPAPVMVESLSIRGKVVANVSCVSSGGTRFFLSKFL